MNTIKIFLAEDGSIADLRKDFDLYQYEYQNKLLNVFVPTSICAGPFVDDNITSGTSCQIKMEAQNSLGAKKISANFYMRIVATENAVKKVVVNGVEYYIFERLLPYAFTIFSGTGVNAPKLTISICNISIEQGGVKLLSVTNTQTCYLTVNPSTQVQSETPQDPSDLDTLFALYNDIATLMPLKQNADTTDDLVVINPNGDNHEVAKNVNDLISDNTTNKQNIGTLQGEMVQAQQDIQTLFNAIGSGLNYVGAMTVQETLPSNDDVTQFVEDTISRLPRLADMVLVKVDKASGTDEIYLYIYSATGWQHFELQFLNNAENGVKGIVQGTYNAATTTANTLMVSITNGAIDEIYYIDSNGHKETLSAVMEQAIAKVVLGTSAVNMALKDGNGNNIVATYQTKQEGASKDYVKQYASPKALYDLNYPDYALGQFKSATVSDTSYNKTTNSTSVGYTTLATITKSLEADILLGDQNGLVNRLWISANITEDVKLRITTAYIDGNNQTQTLSVEETDTFGLVTGIAKLLQIESVFSGLTQPITLPAGTTLTQTIEVWREASASADFTLLSNTTYNAYMTLNKIGYVRYALEQEPSAIETGHDSAPTIDSDGDLLVQSTDGKMHYANGSEQELTTILKVPMASGINANDVRPPKAGDVKTALDGKLDKVTGATTYPQLYAKNADGTQSMQQYTTSAISYAIVQRNGTQIKVPILPSANDDATSKKYVDDGLVPTLKNKGVFNQLWNYESMGNSGSFTKGTNGVINIISTSTFEIDTLVDITITSAHKYFFKINSDCNCGVEIYKSGVTSQNIYSDTIYDSSISDTLSIYIRRQTSPTPTGTLRFFIIDITSLFGAGAEPTLAECQKLFNQDYYEYTTSGKILVADSDNNGFVVEIGKEVATKEDIEEVEDVANTKVACVDVTSWSQPFTAEQIALLTTEPIPMIKNGTDFYMPAQKVSATVILWIGKLQTSGQLNGYSLNANTGYLSPYNEFYPTQTNFAPLYSSANTYSIGDLVMHENGVYRCVTAITTPEAWNDNHWNLVDVETLLKGKLDKDTSSTASIQAYVKNADGTQGKINVRSGVEANSIVRRDGNGDIEIPLTPSANSSATSKKYVDDKFANATDYIVEQGTSGVWGYRKWNSGIAECWTKTPITKSMTPNQPWGSLYNTGSDSIGGAAFPFTFINTPTENAKMTCEQGGWMNWENSPSTTTSGSYQWIRPTVGGTATAQLWLYDIGYWK